MKLLLAVVLTVSFLVQASTANAEMVGSCLIKDGKDADVVALCETLFTDESEKIRSGEDPDDTKTDEEWGESCGGFLNNVGKIWNSGTECPSENLVGVCHDKSGSAVTGRGSLHYYESYVNSRQDSLSNLEDRCISRGKIFTKTNTLAEYEQAIDKIPSDLKTHEVLASCLKPSPLFPNSIPKCEQYHISTESQSLEKRESKCIGAPGQRQNRFQKVNTWSTTDTSCPSKFNYAVCKSAVLSEYLYEDESNIGKENMATLKNAWRVKCESSGRRYIPVD